MKKTSDYIWIGAEDNVSCVFRTAEIAMATHEKGTNTVVLYLRSSASPTSIHLETPLIASTLITSIYRAFKMEFS